MADYTIEAHYWEGTYGTTEYWSGTVASRTSTQGGAYTEEEALNYRTDHQPPGWTFFGHSSSMSTDYTRRIDFYYYNTSVTYTLSISKNGSGSFTGDGTYSMGSKGVAVATVAAKPADGWAFSDWSDGGAQTHDVTLTNDKSLVVTFTQKYTLWGTYWLDGVMQWEGNIGKRTTGAYTETEAYNLRTLHAPGGVYSRMTFYEGDNAAVDYYFITPSQYYTVTVSKSGSGSVDGAGTYGEGDTVTLTATPNSGHCFNYWSYNGQQIRTNPYTFTMPASDVTYVAYFGDLDEYTITYDLNGGNGTTPSSTTAYETSTITLGNPTDLYYDDTTSESTSLYTVTFNPENGDTSTTKQGQITTTEYYHVNSTGYWSINNTQYPFGGYFVMPSGNRTALAQKTSTQYATTTSDAGISKPPNPEKTSFYFMGWYTAQSGGTKVTNWPHAFGGNTTLYAHWSSTSSIPYAVTAEKTQGIASVSPTYAEITRGQSQVYTATLVSSNTWVEGGVDEYDTYYQERGTFNGWGRLSGSGSFSDTTSTTTTFTPTDDCTIRANGSLTTTKRYRCHFSYNANGGTGTAPSTSYSETVDQLSESATISIAENTFTWSGHYFNGWNTEADGSGTEYLDGVSIIVSVDSHSNKVLYAQWITEPPDMYRVYGYCDPLSGGTIDGLTKYPSGYTVALTAHATTSPLYVFDHWDDDTTDTNPTKTFTMPAHDVSFTAHFTPVTHEITTYYTQGGTMSITGGRTQQVGVTVEAIASAYRGYRFAYWNNDTTDTANPRYFTMPDNEITWGANFTALPLYTLSYDAADGTGGTLPGTSSGYPGEEVIVDAGNAIADFTHADVREDGTATGYTLNFYSDSSTLWRWKNGTVTPYSIHHYTNRNQWLIGTSYYDPNDASNPFVFSDGNATAYISWQVTTDSGLKDNTGIPEPDTPIKTGYTFLGWFTEASGGTQITEWPTMLFESDTNLYAHWVKNEYTVYYYTGQADSGTAPGQQTHGYGETINLRENTGNLAKNPTTESSSLTTIFNSGVGSTSVTSTLTTTYTYSMPGWAYTETGNLVYQCGEAYCENQSRNFYPYFLRDDGKSEGSEFTVPAVEREGYILLHYVNAYDSSDIVRAGDDISPTTSKTYNAVWKKVTLTYKPGTGSGEEKTDTWEVGRSIKLLRASTWMTHDPASGTRTYYVTYNTNLPTGSSAEIPMMASVDTSIPVTADGWTIDDTFYASSIYYTIPDNDVIAIAHYVNTTPVTDVEDHGAAFPSEPTCTGYTFQGWWTAATGGDPITTNPYKAGSDTTVYAHWALATYQVTASAGEYGVASVSPSGTQNVPIDTGMQFTANLETGWYLGWTEDTNYEYNKYRCPIFSIWVIEGSGSGTFTEPENAITTFIPSSNGVHIRADGDYDDDTATHYRYHLTYACGDGGSGTSTTVTRPVDGAYVEGHGSGYPMTITTWDPGASNPFSRENYHYSKWSMRSDGGGAAYDVGGDISVTSNTVLYPKWEEDDKYTVTVTVDPEGGGTVDGTGSYYLRQEVTITAYPSTHYTFDGWYQNGVRVDTANPKTFKIDGNVTLEAKFTQDTQTSVTLSCTTGGSITPTAGEHKYYPQEEVTLIAAPDTGYVFGGWYGTGTASTTRYSTSTNWTITVGTVALSYEARFYKWSDYQTSTLFIQALTTGIKCTGYDINQMSISYAGGASGDAPSWTEIGKSEASSGVVKMFNLTLGSIYTDGIRVRFNAYDSGNNLITTSGTYVIGQSGVHTLSFGVTPAGSGTVPSSRSVVSGTSVDVSSTRDDTLIITEGSSTYTCIATANEGYRIVGWQGTYPKTITSNTTLYAEFDLTSAVFQLTRKEGGGATIVSNVTWLDNYTLPEDSYNSDTYTDTYTHTFHENDTSSQQLVSYNNWYTAYTLTAWKDDDTEAEFTPGIYQMPHRNVTYTGVYTSKRVNSYTTIIVPKLSDTASKHFKGWSNSSQSSEIIYEGDEVITPHGSLEYYAVWIDKYTVTVTATPAAGGTVSGGGSYYIGQQVTLTATKNTGYNFDGWYKDGSSVGGSLTYTFTMPSNNVGYEAKFSQTDLDYFNWSKLIAAGQSISNLSAADWAVLQAKINELITKQGGTAITWTYEPEPGDSITADCFMEVRNVLQNLSPSEWDTMPIASAGGAIVAIYFEVADPVNYPNKWNSSLRGRLNRLIDKYNNPE